MIKELRLENFRGFDDHCIPFNPRTTVVVGKNNAGKSTIVEALRLVSAAQFLFCKFVEHQTEGGFWFSMLR